MPWKKVCSFVPCCNDMKNLLGPEGIPYYRAFPEDEGVKIYRGYSFCENTLYYTFKFCPFCSQSLVNEVLS